LRRFQLKLNPQKCTFGVPAGKLLGFLVSSRGIEANPAKITAIERMQLPRCLRDVQKFTGCLASLSRFVSRLGEKAMPLYQLMKKTEKFIWTPQADQAFHELKHMLATAPILAAPMPKEPMMLYIAATNRVVSAVMVVEREQEGKLVQRPVYYLSEVLSTSKQNYPHYQKMTYGVYMAVLKLKHYFEEHPITVVCAAPLAEIIENKDASGRVAKWAIQLSPYAPQYERRDAIKSQALADFLVDWTEMQYEPPLPEYSYWKMHFDGSKMKTGLGAGIVLTSPKQDRLKYVLQIHFAASNNVAEYEAVIHGLKMAKEIGVRKIECYGDSDLVVQQASGTWDALDANMALYRFHVQQLTGFFEGCEFHHIPRAENEAADALSKLGSGRQAVPPGICLEHLRKPSIKPSPESNSIYIPAEMMSEITPMEIDTGNDSGIPGTGQMHPGTLQVLSAESMPADMMDIDKTTPLVDAAPEWARPIMAFMLDGVLPAEEDVARRIQRRAKAYTIINGKIYKRSVTRVLQKCVEPEEGQEILKEIHQGECGHHASSRALVVKAFRPHSP
jgi:ribonuclease HI